MKKIPLWFSLYTEKEYNGDETPYVDVSSIEGVKKLEQNYLIILEELYAFLKIDHLKIHFNPTMVEKAQTWKVQGLRGWCRENYKKQKYFKNTMTLLDSIPNVTNISFNLLEPDSKIKPHSGDTNAIIRCHLGLKIPATAPVCALKVKGEVKEWQAGKVVGFNDAFTHEAWNLTNETRIILLFDIMKPQYIKQKNRVCAVVLTSLFLQRLANIWPKMYNIDRKIYKLTAWPVTLFLWFKFPLVNKINFFRYGVFRSSFYKSN